MLNDEQLLKFIIEQCQILGITGYDIGKNTSISEQSAYKILDGTTKTPRRKTLIKIFDYLEAQQLGKKLGNSNQNNVKDDEGKIYLVEEPEMENLYKRIVILLEEQKKSTAEIFRLRRLLDENNIKHQ